MAVSAGNRAEWGKAAKGFAQVLLDAGQTVTKGAAIELGVACSEALKNLDWMWPRGKNNGPYKSGYRGGDADHPWYTGTLHDSVACGIADGIRLLQASYMEPGATENQKNRVTGEIYDGDVLGQEALQRAVHTFGAGIGGLRAIMVIGVPYANDVNHSDAHYDFASDLEDYFVGEVLGVMEELPKRSFKMK